jgi:transposase-like protein
VRFWWTGSGQCSLPKFGASGGAGYEAFVKINGERHYLRRAVDHEGEILESYVTTKRDKSEALTFLRKALKRHGRAEAIVTDGLRAYPAAMRKLGNLDRREMGRWLNNRAENSHLPFRPRERAMLRFRRMSRRPAKLNRYRNSFRFTPHFATISTRSATSSITRITKSAARPR